MAEQQLEQIEGTVEDIIYENTDNGYMVFEVSGGGVVTVVCGIVGELHAGESVVCRGRYENHATYGRQFHAQECETDMPKDLEAVYAFLASRSLPYIGAKTADKIIDLFGAEALEVIANDPARLTQVPGISADKADRIQQEFKRMFGMRELIAYLAQFEISPRRAMEVFRTFGPGAMQAIAANPYLLCGEPLQLDFRHADSIAQYYHMEGDCAQRLEAALLRTLRHNAGNGHTCLPRTQLLETASNFIHQPPEKLAAALDECIRTEELRVKLFDGTPYIYLPDLLEAEEDIAARLAMLTKRGKNTAHGLDKNIQILELTQGFAYAPLQKEAIRKAMTENCLVLTGGPGTGKTTTAGKLARLFVSEDKKVVMGAADTFRAAAADQLETWGARVNVPVVRSDKDGADPASVAFEASAKAKEENADVLIIDTAGRLQNKSNLMDELGKIRRVTEKNLPVDEVLLVLDATTGQNGMAQAKVFAEAIGLTGVVLSKLDGSAKGGIVISVQKELGVPVKLVGLGEGPDDLAPFDPEGFVDGILA